MAPDETSARRRTIRIPDEEWNAGMAAASRNGETLSAVIRRAITTYAMDGASELGNYQVEYRATSRIALGEGPVVVTGIHGDLDTIRQLYPPTKWRIEERDVSPYRASKRSR
ncbi:hypothetical protein [Nocardia yamanashiensis]|uniref:hypothetical protein n=1 Tax=Nocardia yamanashiensis TaxID=209247 RepID=UPI0008330DD1|nr:hypothetical protein [Nocardia yamanashiensis]